MTVKVCFTNDNRNAYLLLPVFVLSFGHESAQLALVHARGQLVPQPLPLLVEEILGEVVRWRQSALTIRQVGPEIFQLNTFQMYERTLADLL
jgi:hypothetical protein